MSSFKQRLAVLISTSLLATSLPIPAFASNVISPEEAEIQLSDSEGQTAQPLSTTVAHTDFDGKAGNLLIAINPEPWVSTHDQQLPETKNKATGYLADANSSTSSSPSSSPDSAEENLTREFAAIHGGGFCATAEMNKDIKGTPKERTGAALAETTAYQVGDVILKMIGKTNVGNAGVDYRDDNNQEYTSRIYQCLYTGSVSTIWGTVSEGAMTDSEKEWYVALDESPLASPYTGIIGQSDDKERTNLTYEKAQELGKLFDEYIVKEKEYTGDYLVTDSRFGDNDGKAAFLFEPMKADGVDDTNLGYFWGIDLFEQYAGNHTMDGLHLNEDMRNNTTNDQLLTTMLHELQHCIVYGYNTGRMDTWINEWFAQGVSMQVYGQVNDDTEDYCKHLSSNNIKNNNLIFPYAYGMNSSCNGDARYNIYSMAYPLTQYFVEHVNPLFIKQLSVQNALDSEMLSRYLSFTSKHSLQGWLSCFTIALLSEIDGTSPKVESGTDYDLGSSELMGLVRKHYINAVSVNDAIHPLSYLAYPHILMGGGAAQVMRTTSDRTFDILNADEGIVWALRNSSGEIVAVEGLDTVDAMPVLSMTTDPVSANMKIKGVGDVPVNLSIHYNNLTYFKGKAKMTASDLNIKVVVEFVNSTDAEKFNLNNIDVKSAKFKNNKKISIEGIEKHTVSAPTIKSVNIKALPSASKTDKALAKALNKELKKILKKTQVSFDIYPLSLSETDLAITLNKDRSKVKKVIAQIGGKRYKFKKGEFTPILSGTEVIGVKGSNSFTGKYYLGNSNVTS
ncbi:MAG: hypothetical protein K5989_03855 [Lachnospiraceae bacterium]|nr:hypothetical protein [Lachnospiraceae bacterium]